MYSWQLSESQDLDETRRLVFVLACILLEYINRPQEEQQMPADEWHRSLYGVVIPYAHYAIKNARNVCIALHYALQEIHSSHM